MRISDPIRLGIAGAMIASSVVLFPISDGASASAVACPVTRPAPLDVGFSRPAIASEAGGQLRVTVTPLVFIRVESDVLQVSTNTGRPPATADGFYLIRPGRAGRAPASLVETVLRSCR